MSQGVELAIDIVSDVVCPWCYIGHGRLRAVLARHPELEPRVTFHPFLLDPSTPDDGVDLREHLAKKYGRDPEPAFEAVAAQARTVGLAIDFQKVRRAVPTLRAHTLLRHAEPSAQSALADALFEAYFVHGRDVSQVAELTALATRHGFDAARAQALTSDPAELRATRAAAAAAASGGIRSVPTFIFQGRAGFSGAQPESVFERAISVALAAPGLDSEEPAH